MSDVALQVEHDGSFKVVDNSNRGGRTFLGIGAQLTGYKVIICIQFPYTSSKRRNNRF